jgi:hypothetical protein
LEDFQYYHLLGSLSEFKNSIIEAIFILQEEFALF